MKVLLLLNGPEGWQTGIEDGFTHLLTTGKISELKWFYFDEYSRTNSFSKCTSTITEIANKFLPELIVFFHIGKFPIQKEFILNLKQVYSRPIIVYDEGDMYGTWAKPISIEMKTLIKYSDVISIRGLGKFYNQISNINKNIIYTPHHADIARFDREPYLLTSRKYQIVLIGNKIKPKILSNIRRMPGAKDREHFVKVIGEAFPTSFKLFGNGWKGFKGNQGPVDFQNQMNVYRESWITVAYEHYPDIPYYFSNRLPIALLAGSLYVCHYHKGYENIFKGCDFIFFFNKNSEAIDIIKYIQSLSDTDLVERAIRARNFALQYFTPEKVWQNFLTNISIVKLNIAKNENN
jgi:hypothetical protein